MKRLFFDLETSPNIGFFWKSGYKLTISPDNIIRERAVICLAYKWEGHGDTRILAWDKNQSDKAMLKEFAKVANEADELVAHNGDRYDIPWLRTRCLIHGIDLAPYIKSIDTCAWASRKFAFNSNKLDYIAKLLGFEGKTETSYDMWKKITLDNDRTVLAQMCLYCANDVDQLEAVFNKLSVHNRPKTHAGVVDGGPKWSCANCGSLEVRKNKTRVCATGVIQHQMKCKKCFHYFTISAIEYKKSLEAR